MLFLVGGNLTPREYTHLSYTSLILYLNLSYRVKSGIVSSRLKSSTIVALVGDYFCSVKII